MTMDFSLRKTKCWVGYTRFKDNFVKLYVRKLFDVTGCAKTFCLEFHRVYLHELIHVTLNRFKIRGLSTRNEDLVELLTDELLFEELRYSKEEYVPLAFSLFDLLKEDLGTDVEKNGVLVFKGIAS